MLRLGIAIVLSVAGCGEKAPTPGGDDGGAHESTTDGDSLIEICASMTTENSCMSAAVESEDNARCSWVTMWSTTDACGAPAAATERCALQEGVMAGCPQDSCEPSTGFYWTRPRDDGGVDVIAGSGECYGFPEFPAYFLCSSFVGDCECACSSSP